jgi:hypothetical protein
MMGSLPVKNKNNTISNSAPIHEWWSTHAVVKLPFFQTETFYDIPCQVHKAQMDEALMLDGEPLAQQKHWISHKIGDKVVPKLHACIIATQICMLDQSLQQEKTPILGQ